MRPVDLLAMVDLLKSPNAPVMLCQAGYVFVNNDNLSHHPHIREQLQERLDKNVISKVSQCSDDSVAVYCMTSLPVPPERIHAQERSQLFTLNIKPNKTT